MIKLFLSGGVMMWPLLAVALGIAWSVFRTAVRLRGGSSVEEVRSGLDAILFWGSMSPLLGLLATAVGLVVMARAVETYGPVGTSLLWDGVAVSLVTLIFGLLIFTFAAVSWLALNRWSRQAEADGTQV